MQPARGEAAAYLRVSTSPQEADNQREAVQRAAAARGDGELTWFVETGSGRSWSRPALADLSAAIFSGRVRRVYVWKLDRLSRMGIADTSQLVQQWRRAGMRELISAVEGFDFGDPVTGDLLVAMLAWAAKWEWDQQQDRLTAARERRKKAGKSWGRPGELAPATRARIAEMRAETPPRSIRAIAVALKVPKSTVHEACRSVSTCVHSPDAGTEKNGQDTLDGTNQAKTEAPEAPAARGG